MCGGTDGHERLPSVCNGLSPRVRGNLRPYPLLAPALRSIPACAGEPSGDVGDATARRVYPRVCGGTGAKCALRPGVHGLSPRVRGNRGGRRNRRRAGGSIPACAGEPVAGGAKCGATRVYPRVCGGTARRRFAIAVLQGLSPRVRGNRTAAARAESSVRSIPACAGEPLGVLIVTPVIVFAKGIMLRRRLYPITSLPAPSIVDCGRKGCCQPPAVGSTGLFGC